ncbi:hypothetical protein WS99_10775 [Burkholderia territorii]|nr:hypothetical protein WS79_30355 [Burkholderia territorii]KVL55308.1 hypothetical protein WS99_10775 [Burkholderia territorii]
MESSIYSASRSIPKATRQADDSPDAAPACLRCREEGRTRTNTRRVSPGHMPSEVERTRFHGDSIDGVPLS